MLSDPIVRKDTVVSGTTMSRLAMRRVHGVNVFVASNIRIAIVIGIGSTPARRSVIAIKANKRFEGFCNELVVKTA